MFRFEHLYVELENIFSNAPDWETVEKKVKEFKKQHPEGKEIFSTIDQMVHEGPIFGTTPQQAATGFKMLIFASRNKRD